MQRIPRYKMLLAELEKSEIDNPKAHELVKDALKLYSDAAMEINEAVRKHEKLSAFFGEGNAPNPMAGANVRGKIGVNYNSALPKKFQGSS